jgi:AraC family transcriptional regulator
LNVCHLDRLERGVHDFGSMRLVLAREPAKVQMTRHAHDMTSVSVLLSGALVEEAEHREVVGFAGSVVVKPAGVYHANRFGPSDVLICRVDVLAPSDETDAFQRALSRWSWRWHPRALARTREALAGRSGLERDEARSLANDLLRIVAGERHDERAPHWLVEASHTILGHTAPRSQSSVRELANAMGLHRGSLARRFRAEHGFSIRDWRRRVMVERAARAIVGDGGNLSAIAHACGFADHAHMTRAIRAAAGLTPTELRSLSIPRVPTQ